MWRRPQVAWIATSECFSSIWIKKNLKVTGGAGADEGYVYFFDTPLGWQEHYYLYPLPLKQLALNTNLEQNPVWTK